MKKIILASSSPRRKELLAGFGLPFECMDPDIDETGFDDLKPEHRCCFLARAKACAAMQNAGKRNPSSIDRSCSERIRDSIGTEGKKTQDNTLSSYDQKQIPGQTEFTEDWFLGADTLVWLPESGRVYGKPVDAQEALCMLQNLSGCTHKVGTGIALVRKQDSRVISAYSENTVHFARMTVQEMEEYIQSNDWQGVAGGYRIQGHAAKFIDRIEGSWSGIVGLPLRELYVILNEAGFRIPVVHTY